MLFKIKVRGAGEFELPFPSFFAARTWAQVCWPMARSVTLMYMECSTCPHRLRSCSASPSAAAPRSPPLCGLCFGWSQSPALLSFALASSLSGPATLFFHCEV